MTDNDLNPAVVLHMTANGLAIARSLGNRGAIKNQVIVFQIINFTILSCNSCICT